MKTKRSPWLTCAACTLLLFCTVGLTTSAFTIYQPYLISIIGLSNAQASMVITIRSLCSLLAVFMVQKYIEVVGMRRGVILACMCASLAFLLFGFANSYISCCIAAAMLGLAYGLGGTVSVSIAIKRVFTTHLTLALGISTAGTGMATIVFPTISTAIIKHFSLRHAMWFDAAFLALAALLIFGMLSRDVDVKPVALKQSDIKAPRSPDEKKRFCLTCVLAFIIGPLGLTGWSHLGVLYSTEGASPETVSLLITFVGLSLTVGKMIFGQITDLIGGKRSTLIFCAILIVGQVLACFAGSLNIPIALLAMLFLGLGLPLSTVGFSTFASDLATPGHYAASLRYFQLSYMLGSLVFSPVPGIIADHCGSYMPAYCILAGISVLAMILIYCVYHIGKEKIKNA